MIRTLAAAVSLLAIATATPSAAQKSAAQYDERPAKLAPRDDGYGYTRRVVDIPMRDGTKLHTVIAIPKGAKDAGMLMTRTPYDAEELASDTPGIYASLPGADDSDQDPITASGYIRVFQDVRGCTRARAST